MATDESTAAAQEPPRATLAMDGGTQTVRLPAGWELPGTEARLRRVGEGLVLEPIPASASGDVPASPGVPPGYWEWLEEARARGDFGDFDLEEIELRGLRLQDVNLDDSDADVPG